MEESEISKTNLAPALPAEGIRAGLAQLGVDERDLRVLFRCPAFSTLAYRSHQLCFLEKYAHDVLHRTFGLQKLAVLFHMNVRTVRHNLLRGPQQPDTPGRHKAIDEQAEADLIRIALEAFRAGHAMGRKQLLQHARERYDPELTRGWANAFIGGHLDTLQTCRSLPQEKTRLTVPRVQLEEHIQTLKVHVAGKIAELIFNLDELGSADWENRKVKKVIPPAGVCKQDVYHTVSRRQRHIPLLAYVSAANAVPLTGATYKKPSKRVTLGLLSQ
jgi:hypothetical protein